MLFHCKPGQSAKNNNICINIMVRTKTKPFLKRKKVPKFYFHFGQQKKCPPFSTFPLTDCEKQKCHKWSRNYLPFRSIWVYPGVAISQSLAVCVMLCEQLFGLVFFHFILVIVCPSFNLRFLIHLWYFRTSPISTVMVVIVW